MIKEQLRYKIIKKTKEFLHLASDWKVLYNQAESESLHLTWPFFETWLKIYGDFYKIRVVVFYKGNEIVGIAPFMFKELKSKLGFPYIELRYLCDDDQVSFDYLDFLILEKYRAPVLRDLRRVLASLRFDIMNLRNTKNKIPFGVKNGFISKEINSCAYTYLPRSWDEFFLSKNRKFRYNIRARLRNAKKLYKVKYLKCDRDISLKRGFEKLIELNLLRWGKEGEAFRTDQYIQFHWEIMKTMLVEKKLFLRFISMNDEIVSSNYCLSNNNVLYFMQMGRNPAFDKFGVGNLLIAEMIKEAISTGITKIDFLAGVSPYKKNWAEESSDLFGIRKNNSLKGRLILLENRIVNAKSSKKLYRLIS